MSSLYSYYANANTDSTVSNVSYCRTTNVDAVLVCFDLIVQRLHINDKFGTSSDKNDKFGTSSDTNRSKHWIDADATVLVLIKFAYCCNTKLKMAPRKKVVDKVQPVKRSTRTKTTNRNLNDFDSISSDELHDSQTKVRGCNGKKTHNKKKQPTIRSKGKCKMNTMKTRK